MWLVVGGCVVEGVWFVWGSRGDPLRSLDSAVVVISEVRPVRQTTQDTRRPISSNQCAPASRSMFPLTASGRGCRSMDGSIDRSPGGFSRQAIHATRLAGSSRAGQSVTPPATRVPNCRADGGGGASAALFDLMCGLGMNPISGEKTRGHNALDRSAAKAARRYGSANRLGSRHPGDATSDERERSLALSSSALCCCQNF